MKILLVSPYFAPAVGGVETHLTDLCNYLSSRGHTTYVRTYKALSTQDRGQTNEQAGLTQIHRMWWPDFHLNTKLENYPFLRFFYVFTGLFFDTFLFMIQKTNEIDVIQVHGFIASVIGILLGKLFSKRIVINTHVGFNFKNSTGLINKITQITLKNADAVLVLTNNAKDQLLSIGVPEKKIFIYHYWVDQEVFKPQKKSKNSSSTVLFVGRLVPQKGLDTLMFLAKSFPKITFKIVGTGPLADQIIAESKNQKNITFVGKVANTELTQLYTSSDVLLVPSKVVKQTYEEGIPRVIIEALSCGTPVITTKTGGIPDVFTPKMGFMVDDTQPELTSAIKRFYNTHHSFTPQQEAKRLFSIKNAQIIETSLQ